MFLENIIEICVYGESVERFINMCSYHKIQFFNIRKTKDACYMKMYASDFFSIKEIVKKSGVKIKIIKKEGISFQIKKQVKRKTFCIASFFCLFLLWISSHFLWGIQITGNHSVTNDMIKDYLQANGIYYGMPLSKIPIYEIKTKLRNTYDQITWVSIYLKGANLQISIKEDDSIKPKFNSDISYSNIISDENGIVESILVRTGTGMVSVGDEVAKGDILISGKIDIEAEDGTIKETQHCNADGEVTIIYDYPVLERISMEYLDKEYTGRSVKRIEIFLNNQLFSFSLFKIPYIKYDTLTKTTELPLLNVFSIPANIKTSLYREYYIHRKKYTLEEAEKLINDNLNKIILTLEEKGVQIIEKNVRIDTNSAYLSMTGNLKLKKIIN